MPGERAGEHRRAHQPQAGGHQARLGRQQAADDAIDADVRERELREHEPEDARDEQPAPAQRARRTTARGLLAHRLAGSAGSRRRSAGMRGSRSAGARPWRTATRPELLTGEPTARARS